MGTSILVGQKCVLLYVQHLLGSGHLHRVRLVAEELAHCGLRVVVVSGGPTVSNFHFDGVIFVQLEPIRSNGLDFGSIVDKHGMPVADHVFQARQQQLLDTYALYQPQLIVIESWPFGRGVVNEELDSFLQNVKSKTAPIRTVISIRDILQIRSENKQRKTIARLSRFADFIMVHGDSSVVPLDASFSLTSQVPIPIVYTGYVAPPPVPRELESKDVVVAAGGGLAGENLYQLALSAAQLDTTGRIWRFMTGSNAETQADLWVNLPAHIKAEPNRVDFRALLSSSSILISQCGYNSMMDVLVTGIPTIVVPFEGVAETEQLQRATIFSQLNICTMFRESERPERLLALVEFTLAKGEDYVPRIDLDGVYNSAKFIVSLV